MHRDSARLVAGAFHDGKREGWLSVGIAVPCRDQSFLILVNEPKL
jgi:hypothetical protein